VLVVSVSLKVVRCSSSSAAKNEECEESRKDDEKTNTEERKGGGEPKNEAKFKFNLGEFTFHFWLIREYTGTYIPTAYTY